MSKFYYSFDTKSYPGKIAAKTITIDLEMIDAKEFSDRAFPIVDMNHPDIKAVKELLDGSDS